MTDAELEFRLLMLESAPCPEVPKSNRARALAALSRIGASSPPAANASASMIANTVSDALRSVAGYSGRKLDLEIDVAHRGADGGESRARVKVSY